MTNQNGLSYRGSVIDKEEIKTVELPSENTSVIPYTIFSTTKLFRNLPNIDFVDAEVFYDDEDDNLQKNYIKVGDNTEIIVALLNEFTNTNLGKFDLYVYSIVHTFYANGRRFFTNKQVAEKLTGSKLKSKHDLIKKVDNSIFKLSNTTIYLNHKQQITNWNISEKVEVTPESVMRKKLLNLESHLHVKMNNNIVDAHEIVRAPALYEYDSVYKQLVTLDDALTNTQGYLTHTTETIGLKFTLFYRIETMKRMRMLNENKRMNKKDISFKSLYEETDHSELLDAPSKKRTNYLKHIENILKAFKNNGYIKNYHIEGNTKDGKIIIGKIYDKSNNKYL
jgi:hypothetical protein